MQQRRFDVEFPSGQTISVLASYAAIALMHAISIAIYAAENGQEGKNWCVGERSSAQTIIKIQPEKGDTR